MFLQRCIVATGSVQHEPMRPNGHLEPQEYLSSFMKVQGEILLAERVLIIGGGPVGVELACVRGPHQSSSSSALLIQRNGLSKRSISDTRLQEIRDRHPVKSITLVTSGPHILNPGPPSSVKNTGTWIPAINLPKLSDDVAKSMLKRGERPVDICCGERVVIPSSSSSGGKSEASLVAGGSSGGEASTGEGASSGIEASSGEAGTSGGAAPSGEQEPGRVQDWDGSWGALGGMKTITAESGRTWEADYVFYATGNKPNVGLVQSVDASAIKGGLISVDEHLKVS